MTFWPVAMFFKTKLHMSSREMQYIYFITVENYYNCFKVSNLDVPDNEVKYRLKSHQTWSYLISCLPYNQLLI